MNGPTREQLIERARRADEEYLRRCDRVVTLAASILQSRGREALPSNLVQRIDAAVDAREAWSRAVDELCRDQS